MCRDIERERVYVERDKKRKCVCREIQSLCLQRKREMERECV